MDLMKVRINHKFREINDEISGTGIRALQKFTPTWLKQIGKRKGMKAEQDPSESELIYIINDPGNAQGYN